MEVVQHYKGLKVVTEDFVFNNGVKRLLVVLKGTIPIMYKGSTYHIPVAIYLLDTHPYNAPMVFVKPTADMRIKISRHVDHTGKVYLPYLHDWKHVRENLKGAEVVELAGSLISYFHYCRTLRTSCASSKC